MRVADTLGFLTCHGERPLVSAELSQYLSLAHVTAAPPLIQDVAPTIDDTLAIASKFAEDIRAQPHLKLCLKDEDVENSGDRTMVILGLQNTPSDLTEVNYVYYLYHLRRAGVRVTGLAYKGQNQLAGAFNSKGELTPFGVEFVQECIRLGMIVDLSHLNEQSALAVCQLCEEGQVIISHSGVYEVCTAPRNLSLEVMKEVAARSGFVGLIGLTYYLHVADNRLRALIAHVNALLSHIGPEAICFGSDTVYQTLSDEEQEKLFEMLDLEVGGEAFGARYPEFPTKLNTMKKNVSYHNLLGDMGLRQVQQEALMEGNAFRFFQTYLR